MRLLLDEHFSPRRVGSRLAAAGHDVLALAAEASLAGLTDEAVLELAAVEGRVLVTRNAKDFDRITRAWASRERGHAGVLLVWTRETDELGSLVEAILETLDRVGDHAAWERLVVSI